MQVDIKQIDPVTKEITITVEASKAQADYQKYLAKSAKRIQIPGFRKGKAPLARVEREYKESIVASFLEDATDDYFGQAIIKHELGYLSMPQVKELNWEDEQELVIVVEIEHEPKVEIIIPDPLVVPFKPLILEEQVEYILKDTAQKNQSYVQVDKAIKGDSLICELTLIGKNDEEPTQVLLYAGDSPAQRSSDQLIGLSVGDSLNISFPGSSIKLISHNTIPDLDDEMSYSCKLMVNEITRLNIPELDDEFAKDLGFENMDELKNKIADDIKLRIIHKNLEEENNAIIQKLYMDKPFQLPQKTLEHIISNELDDLKEQQYRQYLEMQYRMEFSSQMIKLYTTKALRKITGFELDETKMEEFIEHSAIMMDQTVEVWKDQNISDLKDPELIQQATDWFMLRDLAAKATFEEPQEVQEPEEPTEVAAESSGNKETSEEAKETQ